MNNQNCLVFYAYLLEQPPAKCLQSYTQNNHQSDSNYAVDECPKLQTPRAMASASPPLYYIFFPRAEIRPQIQQGNYQISLSKIKLEIQSC
jgi:hypothetical protein